jgi:FkbM family methyltransferase
MAASRVIDRMAERFGYRFVRESKMSLASGEVYLRQIIDYIGVDFVFDIGANSGQYARLLRSQLGYEGHIFSAEPIPRLAESLRRQASADGNWTVLAAALDATEGTARFNVMQGNQFSSLLAPNPDFAADFSGKSRVEETIEVKLEVFAKIFAEQERRHHFSNPLLKLDTQGTELRILAGAEPVLHRIPAIQTEVSFEAIYDGAPDFATTMEFFESHGYVLSVLFPNNRGHFPRLLEMDAIFIRRERLPAGA